MNYRHAFHAGNFADVLKHAVLVRILLHLREKVAAFRVCEGPLLLLADHRPAPSMMPILAVPNLDEAARSLRARGWTSDGDVFEVPNGPCLRFTDPSGNPFALLQNERPDAMERAYADPDNAHANRG